MISSLIQDIKKNEGDLTPVVPVYFDTKAQLNGEAMTEYGLEKS